MGHDKAKTKNILMTGESSVANKKIEIMPVTYFLSAAAEQSEGKEKQICSWMEVYTLSQVFEIFTALLKEKNPQV